MADDISLVIKVDDKGVVNAVKNTKSLENNVKGLSKAFTGGSLSQRQYYKGIKELAEATGRSEKELRKHASEIRKLEKEQKKAIATTKLETQATKAYTQARREATQEDQRRTAILKANRDALNAQRVATEANTAQVHRYRMASDAVYAAEQKLLQLKKTLRTEVVNGNMTMREAAAVQMQYKQSLNQMSTGLQQGRNRMSSMGVVTQQAGYQVGDFIVQVQGGQSALVAFSQQATQMVGFLPLMAGKLGITAAAAVGLSAALGIGIPIVASLGMIFLAARGKTDKAAESTKGFEEALKSAREEVKGMEGDLRLLQSGFENTFQLGLSDSIKVAEEKLKEARENLLNTIAAQTGMAAGAGIDIGAFFRLSPEDAEAAVKAAEKELEAAKRTAWELQNIKNIREQTVMVIDSQAEAAEAARAKAEDYLSLVSKLEQELGEAEVTALMLAGVDLETGINAGVSAAARLAVQLGVALGVAQQIQLAQVSLSNKNQVYSGRGSVGMPGETDRSGEFKPSKDIVNQADILLGLKDSPKPSSRAGGGGGGKSQADELSEYLQKKQEESRLQEQLLGLFGKERDIQSELISVKDKYNGVMTDAQVNELEATLRQTEAIKEQQTVLEEAKQQQEDLAQSIAGSMGDAFMSIIDGTASVKDAFKSMAAAIIKELLQVLVIESMVKSISGSIGSIFPSANGNVFSGGSHVQAYANGGVVGGPTYFPMSGGKTGLMGEAGPEAIMPLKRGANGKLGVQMEGGGGDNVVINQSFNFQANGDDSVKKLIAQAAPKIAQMTKSSMLDDRRRGGQTKSVFG